MKAKQWVKDYLDFAMPLIMVVVALNLISFIIVAMIPEVQLNKFRGFQPGLNFFSLKAYYGVFIEQMIYHRVIMYSFIFLCSALIIKILSNSLKITLILPFVAIFLFYASVYEFGNRGGDTAIVILVDGFILLFIFLLLFTCLKIFFANCNFIIKNVSYISIFTLSALELFALYSRTTIIVFIVGKIFLVIASLLTVMSIYYILKNNKNIDDIIPQDIKNLARI